MRLRHREAGTRRTGGLITTAATRGTFVPRKAVDRGGAAVEDWRGSLDNAAVRSTVNAYTYSAAPLRKSATAIFRCRS